MNVPIVSIIVPVYNVEPYLERCIQSLLNQSLKDIEIILVDDESPDNCPMMCDQYALMDSRVKVIHKKNGGLGFARNSGLEIATGEFVAFVDSDDYVEKIMYEKLYQEARNSNADAVYSNFYVEQSTGVWIKSEEVNQKRLWVGDDVISFMLDMISSAPYVRQERKYQMSVWHSIYRSSIIKKFAIRFLSERQVGSEDIPFQVDFLLKSKKVVYMPEMFYHYCNNAKSLTAKYKLNMFDMYKNLYNILVDKTKNISSAQQRIDRFFIGYSRYCIIHLSLLNKSIALPYLNKIVNDTIWEDISSRYKFNYLCLWQRLLYWLTIKKKTFLLRISGRCIYQIKGLQKRRNN